MSKCDNFVAQAETLYGVNMNVLAKAHYEENEKYYLKVLTIGDGNTAMNEAEQPTCYTVMMHRGRDGKSIMRGNVAGDRKRQGSAVGSRAARCWTDRIWSHFREICCERVRVGCRQQNCSLLDRSHMEPF